MTVDRLDRGSGSVLAVSVIATIALLILAVTPLCVVLVARASIANAADASALAAADVRVGLNAGFPCEVAARVAKANSVALKACRFDGLVATVSVERAVLGFGVEVSASAGPPP